MVMQPSYISNRMIRMMTKLRFNLFDGIPFLGYSELLILI